MRPHKFMNWMVLLVMTGVPAAAETSIGLRSSSHRPSLYKRKESSPFLRTESWLETPRGGAKKVVKFDNDAVFFAKVGVSASLETLAMLGCLVGTKLLSDQFAVPKLAGLSILQWLSLFVIAYAFSFLSSIIEGGVSAASNQILDPKVVPASPEWYSKLRKPSWNPPGWVFPIMWLIVSKPTQMVAMSKVLKAGPDKFPGSILSLFCGHLALGNAWNKVFFGMQCIGRGTAIITMFYAMLWASTYAFYQLDPSAGLFLLPTCGWVTVATTLNWSIYLKNKT